MWDYDRWLLSAADESAAERYLPDNYVEPEKRVEYCINYSYIGCKNEFSYYAFLSEYEDFDASELEFRFMRDVREGKIKRGIPKNLDDLEILEIMEVE